MRVETLVLAFLLFCSALAGCLSEDIDRDDDLSEDIELYGKDTDMDGIADEDEERRYRTDPLNDDTDGDGVIDGWEITYGYDPLNGTDDALRALCEWYESNETADQSIEALCNSNDNDRDDRDEDREITQEDCERRNGTWAEAPDRPREFYCDFGDRDSEEESRFRYSNITLRIFHGENLENSTVNYTIKIQLNHSAAPIHADNFLKHVLYGNFNNSTFHRIIDDFMIQGGDFQNSSGAGGYAADWYGICNGTRIANQSDCPNQENWNIPDEADNGLRHLPCTISMAKTAEPNTGGSQFFLIPGDITHHNWLDGIHTVFGEVTEGCEHITSLSEVETGEMNRPVVTVVIFSATVDN